MNDIKILDLEFIENFNEIVNGKFIVYGTGSKADMLWPVISKSGLDIVACCDGDEQRRGSIWNDYKIETLDEVESRMQLNNVVVLICSSFVKEIIADINEKYKVNCRGVITEFSFQWAFLLNRNSPKLSEDFKNWYKDKWEFWFKYKKKSYAHQIQKEDYDRLISWKCSNPILVYQAGKVGSSSVANSIEHSLQTHRLCRLSLREDTEINQSFIKNIIDEKEKIKIITMVRDPIARDLSSVFQGMEDPSVEKYRNFSCDLEKSIINHMKKIKGVLFNWFDIELKAVFEIDVFEHPFDKEKGYSIIEKNNIECLVLKLEKLNDCSGIIGKFVGKENFELKNDNLGGDKPYSYVYSSIKDRIHIPSELIDFYYGEKNEKIRHFYSEKEITAFKEKWER